MNEHFVATTRTALSKTAATRLDRAIRKIDPAMNFVGPVNIPGNAIHGWIVRPNDGTNDYDYQRALNRQAAELLSQVTEARR